MAGVITCPRCGRSWWSEARSQATRCRCRQLVDVPASVRNAPESCTQGDHACPILRPAARRSRPRPAEVHRLVANTPANATTAAGVGIDTTDADNATVAAIFVGARQSQYAPHSRGVDRVAMWTRSHVAGYRRLGPWCCRLPQVRASRTCSPHRRRAGGHHTNEVVRHRDEVRSFRCRSRAPSDQLLVVGLGLP